MQVQKPGLGASHNICMVTFRGGVLADVSSGNLFFMSAQTCIPLYRRARTSCQDLRLAVKLFKDARMIGYVAAITVGVGGAFNAFSGGQEVTCA